MDQAPVSLLLRRTAGILLHPTSLPSGEIGPDAARFADYLRDAGQSAWQVMPLGPPGPGGSPYAARSAFAGNSDLLSLDRLADERLLDDHEVSTASRGTIDDIRTRREALLRLAFERFENHGRGADIDRFQKREWVRPFALWTALRARFEAPWWEWPRTFRSLSSALDHADHAVHSEARYQAFIQLMFEWQWLRLKHHANGLGIALIGDLPIFVDRDSADAWANPTLFKLDADLAPEFVAGVPPDAFSSTGQRWGNPLYDWDALEETGYAWWVARMRRTLELVDAVRLDHFRGFESAWEIPVASETAIDGEWVPGPGLELFAAIERAVGKGRCIVEDLGMITEAVRELRRNLGYPGMAVLQFAFGDALYTFQNPHLPHHHEPGMVVYTGTHDNDTTRGWYEDLGKTELLSIARYLGAAPVDGAAAVDAFIRLAYASTARTAIIPLQDVLQLGSEARMNIPGTSQDNWTWRFTWDDLQPGRADWLRDLAGTYARFGPPKPESEPEN